MGITVNIERLVLTNMALTPAEAARLKGQLAHALQTELAAPGNPPITAVSRPALHLTLTPAIIGDHGRLSLNIARHIRTQIYGPAAQGGPHE